MQPGRGGASLEPIRYELRKVGDHWHLLCNGQIACVSVTREPAIDTIAAFHRCELRGESYSQFHLIGLTLGELRNSRVLDINWRRKGPPIQLARFEEAEEHLSQPAPSGDVVAAHLRYERAMAAEDFCGALDQLILIGDRMRCSPQYWHILQTIVSFLWSTPHIVPHRKQRGQLETKIQFVDRRARGDWEWTPKLAIEGYAN